MTRLKADQIDEFAAEDVAEACFSDYGNNTQNPGDIKERAEINTLAENSPW